MHATLARIDADIDADHPADPLDPARGALLIGPALALMVVALIATIALTTATGSLATAALIAAPVTGLALLVTPNRADAHPTDH